MGGRHSKKVTVGFRYYAGFHFVTNQGCADYVLEVRIDDKVVFSDYLVNGGKFVNLPNLFGGDSGEGGVRGYINVANGHANQYPNPYLQKHLGANIPAYRGVTSVIASGSLNNKGGFYVGINPYLKSWDFLVQRIHKDCYGFIKWYDEKAEIPIKLNNTKLVDYNTSWLVSIDNRKFPTAPNLHDTPINFVDTAMPIGYNKTIWGELDFPYKPETTWPYGKTVWFKKKITCNGQLDLLIKTEIYDNNFFVFFDGNLVNTTMPEIYKDGTHVRIPVSFTVSRNMATKGTHEIIICSSDFQDSKYALRAYIFLSIEYIAYKGMNPAHIIHEVLTDTNIGLGLDPVNDIDDANFKEVADKLYNEDFPLCMLWDGSTNCEDFLADVLRHIDANLSIDRFTGKYKIKLIRNDYNVENLITLDETCIKSLKDFKVVALTEMNNKVQITYWDIYLRQNSVITVSDIALYQMQGEVIASDLKYDGIPTSELAERIAQRDLKSLSSPLISCTITATVKAAKLQIGDVFLLNWSLYDLNNKVMRVTSISYGDGINNSVVIECVEDVFDTPTENMLSIEDKTEWSDTTVIPKPLDYVKTFEVPYINLVYMYGQNVVDLQLKDFADYGIYGVCAAQKQSASSSAIVYDDSTGNFESVGELEYAPFATIKNNINELTSRIALEDIIFAEKIDNGQLALLGDEIISVVDFNYSNKVIVIQRGLFDTAPTKHNSGTTIYLYDYSNFISDNQFGSGETITNKLTPRVGVSDLDINAVTTLSQVTFVGRAIRPYPPANVKINDEYFPNEISRNLEITWASRNRLQQTSTGSYISFTDRSVTSEDGVTYGYTIGDQNGKIWKTVEDITTLNTTILFSDLVTLCENNSNYRIRLTLYSKRDNYKSFTSVINDFEVKYITGKITTKLPDLIDKKSYNFDLEYKLDPEETYKSSWKITKGELPYRLYLSSDGKISGTYYANKNVDSYEFTITISLYKESHLVATIDQDFIWVVTDPNDIVTIDVNNAKIITNKNNPLQISANRITTPIKDDLTALFADFIVPIDFEVNYTITIPDLEKGNWASLLYRSSLDKKNGWCLKLTDKFEVCLFAITNFGNNNTTGTELKIGKFLKTNDNLYKVKIICVGTKHEIYINDVEVINFESTLYTSGMRAGLYANLDNNAYAEISDITFKKIQTKEIYFLKVNL